MQMSDDSAVRHAKAKQHNLGQQKPNDTRLLSLTETTMWLGGDESGLGRRGALLLLLLLTGGAQ